MKFLQIEEDPLHAQIQERNVNDGCQAVNKQLDLSTVYNDFGGTKTINEKKVLFMEAGAIILAGGKSSRMGTNKALLQLNKQANIKREANQLQKYFSDLIVVTNHQQDFSFLKAFMVTDHFYDKGPLAGIHAGLSASPNEVNVVVACDMPFLSAKLAKKMADLSGGYDAVVPVIKGERHPLFSVFKKKLAVKIAESIAKEQLSMMDFLDRIKVRYLMEKDLQTVTDGRLEQIFFNMNSPIEYKMAKKWAEGESSERK